jgi:DNA-binding response OmpR family regulator
MAAENLDSNHRSPTRCVRLRKVLVIDRDAFWGPAIQAALEETGYYLNLVADAREGCRRAMERAYDLVIVSASMGMGALVGILESLSHRISPPCVIVLAGADELRMEKDQLGVPCLSILRPPFAVEDVVDTARTLVGVPWSDHRKGA